MEGFPQRRGEDRSAAEFWNCAVQVYQVARGCKRGKGDFYTNFLHLVNPSRDP
jgi:hypothetical protein